MLGFVFVYFLGRYFYRLAEAHQRSKWGYAVLGVLFYYFSGVLMAIAYVAFQELVGSGYDEEQDQALELAAIPAGFLGCYLLYQWLKRRWSRVPHFGGYPDILDQDFVANPESDTTRGGSNL